MNDEAPRSWPPREGKAFFLLWVAGLLVQGVVSKLVMFASAGGGGAPSIAGNPVNIVYALCGVALGAWQAWLLFPRGWRMVLWALLPIPMYVVFYATAPRGGLQSAVLYQAIQIAGVAIHFGLVVGVRQRSWLYLVTGIGALIAWGVAAFVIFGAGRELFDRVASAVPYVSLSQVLTAAYAGVGLLIGVTLAAVLAWWMPPLRHE